MPGEASPRGKDGKFLYEDVWKYLFTHPVGETGRAVRVEEGCERALN
jgi:hypothetical protein